ncbi:MAG: hypothetical protein PHW65_03895, partial [Dehalococcoidales bacterium]|nr:hypothetical protein [Dehalococcoidales bacterium]
MPWIKDEYGNDVLVPEGGFDYFQQKKSVPAPNGNAFSVSGNVSGEVGGWTIDEQGNHVLIPAGGFDYFQKKKTVTPAPAFSPDFSPEMLSGGGPEPAFNVPMLMGPVNIDTRTGKPTTFIMPPAPGTREMPPVNINKPVLPESTAITIEDVVHAQDPLIITPESQTASTRALQQETVPGFVEAPITAIGDTDTFKSLIAGLYSNIPMAYGGGMEWAGDKFGLEGLSGAGQNFWEFGETTAELYADPDWAQPVEFKSWGQALTDPRFYTRNVMRNVPLMASLIIPTILGGELGGAVAGVAGWGRLGALGNWGTKLLQMIGAQSTGVPLEAALEAGGVYTEAKNRGLSEEEAMQAADDTFAKNAALLSVTNLPELAAMFSPAPKWLVKMLGVMADSKLGRAAIGAGRIGMAGAAEGLEEGSQEAIQRSSLGDEINFDPAMQESIAQGLILGGGPGIVGALQHEMQSRAYNKASKKAKKSLEVAVEEKVNAGTPVEEAVKQVFDEFAGTEEGDKVVGEAMQEVIQDVADVEKEVVEKQKSAQQPSGQQPVQEPMQQLPVQQLEQQPTQQQTPDTPQKSREEILDTLRNFFENYAEDTVKKPVTEQVTEPIIQQQLTQEPLSTEIIEPQKPVQAPVSIQQPVEPEPVSGKPFQAEMYQGRGKSRGEIYNWVETPIAGEGQYYAFSEEDAKRYGDEVSKHTVNVDNPLIISNDVEWRKLTKEAGWDFPNLYGTPKEKIAKMIESLKRLIISKGHGGLLIQMEKDDRAKTLRKAFGHDQVVVYEKEVDKKPQTVRGEGPAQEPTKQPKYGRNGNNVFKKWAKNEYVMADLDKSDDPYVQAYRQFFEKWYQAGKGGIRTIDVPFNHEIDSQFPHFLKDVFYQAGRADVRAQPQKGVPAQPEPEKQPEPATKPQEKPVAQEDVAKT